MINSAAVTAPDQRTQDNPNITFTRFKGDKPTTKEFSKVDGVITKKPAIPTAAGIAERVSIPFSEFCDELAKADYKTAFIYGQYASERDLMYMVSKEKKGKHPGNDLEITRTKNCFGYAAAPGILGFDHDPSPFGKDMTPADFIRALGELYPPILDAARIVRGSCSAGVHLAGEQPKSSTGFHVYVPVSDASDIPRFASVLSDLSWIAGYGFHAISKCGSLLPRTFFDEAVYSAERLDYVGSPLLRGEGLVYTAPAAEYTPGTTLDTRGLI